MPSLIFDRVAFAFAGGDDIFTDVSVTFGPGWTALVGDNGAGKTTLLEIASGARAAVKGAVRRVGVGSIAVVAQRVDEPDARVVELAGAYDRAAMRWRARFALGDDDVARWPTLSPGERKRWQIAAALAGEPDVVIVDEPANHLDAAALAQVVELLAGFGGVGVIVSHDRALLDRLATQTVRLAGGAARAWPGNYTAARAAWDAEAASARTRRAQLAGERRRAERQLADARRRADTATRAQSTSARMRSPDDHDARGILAGNLANWGAATAGRAVGRAHTHLAAARDAEGAIAIGRERGAAIAFPDAVSARRWVVQLALPRLVAGDRELAREVALAIGRDDRVWLRGDNGAGKSTLVRALLAACTLPPERIFALAQDLPAAAGAALAAEIRALDHATRGRVGQLVDALGADPERATSSTSPSPGEARKLALALGLARAPQLVVLDEPTNHLDLASVERLEAALAAYPGALLVVTHDERFAAAIACTRRWTMTENHIRVIDNA